MNAESAEPRLTARRTPWSTPDADGAELTRFIDALIAGAAPAKGSRVVV